MVRALRRAPGRVRDVVLALPLPGTLSTRARHGQRAVLHHQRRHGALHGRKAGVEPALAAVAGCAAGQNSWWGRSAGRGAAPRCEPRSVSAMASRSIAWARYWPWKLPPEMTSKPPPASGEDQRVVGRRIDLDADDAVDIVERVDHRPMHLRGAAQRVDVLDARGERDRRIAGLVRKDQLPRALRCSAREPSSSADVRGDADLARLRAGRVDAGDRRRPSRPAWPPASGPAPRRRISARGGRRAAASTPTRQRHGASR